MKTLLSFIAFCLLSTIATAQTDYSLSPEIYINKDFTLKVKAKISVQNTWIEIENKNDPQVQKPDNYLSGGDWRGDSYANSRMQGDGDDIVLTAFHNAFTEADLEAFYQNFVLIFYWDNKGNTVKVKMSFVNNPNMSSIAPEKFAKLLTELKKNMKYVILNDKLKYNYGDGMYNIDWIKNYSLNVFSHR